MNSVAIKFPSFAHVVRAANQLICEGFLLVEGDTLQYATRSTGVFCTLANSIVCSMDMKNAVAHKKFKIDEQIAYEKFNLGFKPTYSTGICGSITAGYGKLCVNGYFQFPLAVDQNNFSILSEKEFLID